MRTDQVWFLLVYAAIAGSVCGAIWLRHRHNESRLREVSERAARLASSVPAQRHPVDPRRRPFGSTVYWSREAIKEKIIEEYDSSRTTIVRRRPDPAEIARVWNLARRVGQNDQSFTADLVLQDHEPPMSRDLDIQCYPALRDVTKVRPETDV